VRFFSDGISRAPVQTQIVPDGGSAVNPGSAVIDPTHIPVAFIGKYLSFLGWYEEGAADDAPYDFESPVTGDLNLYGRFTTDLLISYLDAGGKVFLSKRIEAESPIPLPTADEMQLFAAPAGKRFDGWAVNGARYDGTAPRRARVDTVLTPILEDSNDFYVFFVSDGTQTPFAIVSGNDARVPRPADPARRGYAFSHWSDAENGPAFDFTAPIDKDTTLYAVWTAQPVDYTIVFWYEKPDVAGDPGTAASNYIFYRQSKGRGLAGSAAADIDTAALLAAHRGDAPPYATYSHVSYSARTLLGNGSTVVNVYFKRIVYRFTFDLASSNATLHMGGQDYTDSNKYAYSAKYEQNITELWPGNSSSVTTSAAGQYCTGWETPEYETPFVSKVLRVSADMLPQSGTEQTVTARWSARAHRVNLHYMFESLYGNVAGAVSYGGKYYIESEEYSQSLLSSGTVPFNLKSIDGMAPLTSRALVKSGSAYIAVSDSRTDQYLFYDRRIYSLDFNAQGGTARKKAGLDYAHIRYGARIDAYKPDDPVPAAEHAKDRFEGWYYDASYLRPFDFSEAEMPGANLLLFAKWSAGQFSVSVYDDLTRDRPPLTYGRGLGEYVGDPSQERAAQGLSAYETGGSYDKGKFLGWVVYVGPGKTAPLSYETPVTQDMAIYARWDRAGDAHRITYNSGDGSGGAPTDGKTYEKGTQARILPGTGISKDGEHFIGWRDDANGRLYNPGSLIKVDSDISLTAQFAADSAAVSLVYHNSSPGDSTQVSQYAEIGGAVALAGPSVFAQIPSAAAYRFAGWSTEANGGGALCAENDLLRLPETAGGVVNLYAVWTPVSHHILRFDAGAHGSFTAGARTLFAAEDGKAPAKVTPPAPSPSEDYAFSGWSPAFSETDPVYTDILYTAQYKTRLRFHANYTAYMGQGPDSVTTGDLDLNAAFAMPGFAVFGAERAPAGYEFLGWAYAQDGTLKYAAGASLLVTEAAPRDFYAVWKAPAHTLRFLPGDHGAIPAGMKAAFSLTDGQSFASLEAATATTVPAIRAEAGYRFTGWQPAFDRDAPVTADISYTAVYEALPENTVEYHANYPQGTQASPPHKSQSARQGTALTLPGFENLFGQGAGPGGGYSFLGWGESAGSAAAYHAGASLPIPVGGASRTVKLYAIWKAPDRYTVSFALGAHGEGWREDSTPSRYVAIANQRLSDLIATVPAVSAAPGWVFAGWKNESGNTPFDENGQVSADVTYTAQYGPGPDLNVKYSSLSSNSGVASWEYPISGGAVHTLLQPETLHGVSIDANWIFLGWRYTASGEPERLMQPGQVLLISEDTEFVAKWDTGNETSIFTVTFLKGDHGAFAQDARTAFKARRQESLIDIDPPVPAPDSGYSFTGWEPRLRLGDPVTRDLTYTAQYRANPPASDDPAAQDDGKRLLFSGHDAADPPGAGEIKVKSYAEPYDAEKHTVLIELAGDLAAANPQVFYSDPRTPRTLNWVRATRAADAAPSLSLSAFASASDSGVKLTAGFYLPAFMDAGSHELPLYFTAEGFTGAGIIRYVEITRRPITVTAEHAPVYAGDAAPEPGDGGYAASVSGLLQGDSLNVNTLRFRTDYRQGDPAGDYDIWVPAGIYGNYEIEKTRTDPDSTVWAKAGVLQVLARGDDDDRKGGSPGGGAAEAPPALNRDDHYAYIVGYPDGLVHPERNITREEAATIFFRLLTEETRDAYRTAAGVYSDVDAARWSNEAIATLSAAGILTGYEDGAFRPSALMTRAEFTAIAARFDGGGDAAADAFDDTAGHWARAYIDRAYARGWVTGYEDGSFRPDRRITRAEVAALINRALLRHVESTDDLLPGMRVFSDNADPALWYYFDIQEAANSHAYERKEDGLSERWTELLETPVWN
jgi:hypothetical protein